MKKMIIAPRNWSDLQHYKDRCPPWVKLPRSLLDDFEFHCLPVASKALAPLLWLLASENLQGHIDADHEKIAFRLRMSVQEVVDAITPLIDKGFFILVQNASKPLALHKRNAIPETETETEKTLSAPAVADAAKASYRTKRGRQLQGTQLEAFERFWKTFAYAKGRAEAADAWLDLKPGDELLLAILAGAEREARARPALLAAKRTPKMAQGWLSGRRWEDGAAPFPGNTRGGLPVDDAPTLPAGEYT